MVGRRVRSTEVRYGSRRLRTRSIRGLRAWRVSLGCREGGGALPRMAQDLGGLVSILPRCH
jgi:hypothetical protein